MIKHPLCNISIAIVYDHLTTTYGGAELVLQVLLQLFPKADLFTSVFEENNINWIKKNRVHTSFLQKLGPLKKYHQVLLPLHPIAIEQLDLSEYQIVISVTAGVAKGVLTNPKQLHVSYMLTPPRYLNDQDPEQNQYVRSQKIFIIPGVNVLVRPLFSYLRIWDQLAAWRPDKIIAISELVATRITKRYNRKVDKIVYPPFIPLHASSKTSSDTPPFLLSFSRLVSYKRIDLSIKSSVKLKKIIVVAGEGIEQKHLLSIHPDAQQIRKKNQSIPSCIQEAVSKNKLIVFVGNCTENEKSFLLSHCLAVLLPGQEDFGLIGLEAAYFGKPIITNSNSGIAEILTADFAVHVHEKSVSAICAAIKILEKHTFNPTQLKAIAHNYVEKRFSDRFLNTLYQFWKQHSTISAVSSKT